MKKVKLKLELQYNSPVILTFFLLSLLVLFLDQWTDGWTTMHLFCVYRSSLKDPLLSIRSSAAAMRLSREICVSMMARACSSPRWRS